MSNDFYLHLYVCLSGNLVNHMNNESFPSSVADDGPVSTQHWANASCLLGRHE